MERWNFSWYEFYATNLRIAILNILQCFNPVLSISKSGVTLYNS